MQFSIILCTYNRLEYLKKSIDALLRLDYPEYEIVIVNDASTDGTKDFLDALHHDKIAIVHHGSNKGLSESRNTGIKHSRFGVVAFTDDDCVVDAGWLAALARGFTSDDIDFVMGQTVYIRKGYVGYFPERLIRNPGARWPGGGNIAYRRSVFAAFGGFDDVFYRYNNEDSEMAIRAVQNGCRYERAPDAIIYHQAMEWTVASLLHSAKNASVWVLLKKTYPDHYMHFHPPVTGGMIIHAKDYALLLAAPIVIPLLLLRYLLHGKRNIKLFFAKWPAYLFLRRYYIYREAIKHRVFML